MQSHQNFPNMKHEIDVEAHVLENYLILPGSIERNLAVYYPTIVVVLKIVIENLKKKEISNLDITIYKVSIKMILNIE